MFKMLHISSSNPTVDGEMLQDKFSHEKFFYKKSFEFQINVKNKKSTYQRLVNFFESNLNNFFNY